MTSRKDTQHRPLAFILTSSMLRPTKGTTRAPAEPLVSSGEIYAGAVVLLSQQRRKRPARHPLLSNFRKAPPPCASPARARARSSVVC